jgi:hypothetical protein
MKTENKNNNAITINLNDDYKAMIDKLAQYYQRKTADYIRVILQPVLIDEYKKMMLSIHKENTQPIKQAIFKK